MREAEFTRFREVVDQGGIVKDLSIDARAGDKPFVNCLLEPEARSAEIAHRCEAAHQSVCGFVASHEIVVTDIPERLCGGRARQHRVPMRVDQAGH